MSKVIENKERGQWGSKLGFILAAAGSAVGLGNLWKFPYKAGTNGGGAFVLVYVIIVLLLGFSLMIAEIALGRNTQLNAIGAYSKINKKWGWVGALGVLAAFLILSFYSVVGGWVINYLVKSATGALKISDANVLKEVFGGFVSSTTMPIIYHGIFMLITLAIVFVGIDKGIEKASKIMMPSLFVIIIILAIRSVTLPGAMEGVKYFIIPDFSKINMSVVLDALGQVFFSLSLGMGCMITYGSYLGKDTNIPKSGIIIPLIDTAIALLAGFAILPAVFAFGFKPDQGPGLMFVTLPAVFSKMPLGTVFAVLFFILVLFAALTSSISLLEVVVAYIVDKWNFSRQRTSIAIAIIIFLVGIPASLSQGVWSNIHLLGNRGFFDTYDFIASNILLPLGGFLLCIFVGWIWKKQQCEDEITNGGEIKFRLKKVWFFLIKYICPVAILIVFLRSIK
ncbi:sodium-dependent transporter [Haloimpatiens lingqiaonensis]|uniref:sodium-dependent transporter n=1 Tax=Haloimpatiens lingqiaonensis TaxID=1380675 RepID=UPI0014853880|nr:sodium-dependent transporter [Haloimpatiens lingqiaonensis]